MRTWSSRFVRDESLIWLNFACSASKFLTAPILILSGTNRSPLPPCFFSPIPAVNLPCDDLMFQQQQRHKPISGLCGVCHHFRSCLRKPSGCSFLASTPCDSTWNMHVLLRPYWVLLEGYLDGRPKFWRPILWIFDGVNEQEKYRTKHFVGLLDSLCVRNNGQEERIKYWKLCDKSTVGGRRVSWKTLCCLRWK